jgi:hypothetical protein
MLLSTRRALLVLVGAGVLMTAIGCTTDPRTANQGGGTLLSASTKLLNQKIGDLTADEWQIIADNIPALAAQFNIDLHGIQIPDLTDEQAQAIVDFLASHNIVTIDELKVAIESGQFTEADVPVELQEFI